MTPIRREWMIGENIVYFEPPDLLRVKYRGVCSLQEATQMVETCRELATRRPVFILGDMEEAGALDAEARHYFSEHFKPEWIQGLIYYKTRLLHKAVLVGLRLAIEMARVETSPLLWKIHFVSTQEKAEALLTQLRAQPDTGSR